MDTDTVLLIVFTMTPFAAWYVSVRFNRILADEEVWSRALRRHDRQSAEQYIRVMSGCDTREEGRKAA